MQQTNFFDQAKTKAVEYVGTKFVHQGRLKQVGVDCVGLVIGIGRELGCEIKDPVPYPPEGDPDKLKKFVAEHFAPCEIQPGAIGVFWYAKRTVPQHFGVFSEQGIVQAYWLSKKVVETSYGKFWKRRFIGAYRWQR